MFASIMAAIRSALSGIGRGFRFSGRGIDWTVGKVAPPLYWTLYAATLPFQWIGSAFAPRIAGSESDGQDMAAKSALAQTMKLLADAKARKAARASAPKPVAVEDLLPLTVADKAYLIKRFASAVCDGRPLPGISRLPESERAWADYARIDHDHAKNLNSATRSAIEGHMTGRRYLPHLSPLPDAAWLNEARRGCRLEDRRIKAAKEASERLENEFGFKLA